MATEEGPFEVAWPDLRQRSNVEERAEQGRHNRVVTHEDVDLSWLAGLGDQEIELDKATAQLKASKLAESHTG